MSKDTNGKGTPKTEAAKTNEKNSEKQATEQATKIENQVKDVEEVFSLEDEPKNPPQKALSIEELQILLKKEIEVLNRKSELASNRDLFLSKRAELVKCKKVIEKEANGSMFETKSARLSFECASQYNRLEDLFTVSNPTMILKFINAVSDEIDLKVRQIEAELLGI